MPSPLLAARVLPLVASLTALSAFIAPTLGQTEPKPEGSAAKVVASVSADRCREAVDTLCSFGTRHTLSATDDPARGIGAARNWLKAQFEEIAATTDGRMTVSLESFDVPKSPSIPRLPNGATVVNVVAVLQGTSEAAKARRYYVVGHYDTINAERLDATGDAPGANDDASGTAVVLECARVLAAHPLEATVVFLCTAAEEQGLVGAKLHAEAAAKRGDLVAGVLSNDIVGDPGVKYYDMEKGWQSSRNHVRLFSEGLPRGSSAQELAEIRQLGKEGDSPSRQLARYILDIAQREALPVQPVPILRFDRFLRGGDHTAFNESGFSAVRFSVPAEDYSRQHQNVTQRDGKPYGDVPEFVDAGYVADVAKLNAAVLYHLANAPAAPAAVRMVTKQLETGTTLRWKANQEADVAGYEVMWRRTTSLKWEGSFDAGTTTEWTSEASKDNYFFGVRAYDKAGFRSPVTFAGAASE